jgi:hypothetical protein
MLAAVETFDQATGAILKVVKKIQHILMRIHVVNHSVAGQQSSDDCASRDPNYRADPSSYGSAIRINTEALRR